MQQKKMNTTHTSLKKKGTYLKCKSSCQSLATTKLPPPMKLQLVGQCKDMGSTNHKGET